LIFLSFIRLCCASFLVTFITMDEKDTKSVVTPPPEYKENTPAQPLQPKSEIMVAPPADYEGPKAKTDHMEDARGWESENLIQELDKQLEQEGYKKGFLDLEFKNPKHFTWMLVAFASMGGLLSGLDQSLISGANLTLPKALGLTDQQNSLVNSGMPLGGMYSLSAIDPSTY
jgi:hypothetical protein